MADLAEPVQVGLARLDPASLLHVNGAEPFSVLELWSWAFSNPQDNANRGVLAEFIVANAIGAEISVRGSWDDLDLLAPGEVSVEVEATAFLQAWNSSPKAPPSFSGLKAKSEPLFRASVYVFALQTAESPREFDPLDLGQWQFWVASRNQVQALNQNSMRHSIARAQFGERVSFERLDARYREVLRHVG